MRSGEGEDREAERALLLRGGVGVSTGLTEDQLSALAEYILGTCKSLPVAMDYMALPPSDVSEVEAALLSYDVERCGECDWWCEVCELEFDDNAGHGVCADCRGARGE